MPCTFDRVSWPVRTERLALRPATEHDVDATWRYRRLDEVARYIGYAPATREEYHAVLVDRDRLGKTLVVERERTVIGDLMLAVQNGWAQREVADMARDVQAELGWAFDPSYGGQGYATEAVTALLGICFGELRLRRVTASCFADNTASWRLMERLGMRRESQTLRDSLHRSGAWLDGMSYALLAEEWQIRSPRG